MKALDPLLQINGKLPKRQGTYPTPSILFHSKLNDPNEPLIAMESRSYGDMKKSLLSSDEVVKFMHRDYTNTVYWTKGHGVKRN